MALSRKTQPRIWETTYLLNRAIIRGLREEIGRLFLPGTPAKILDVGCGSMPYRGLLEGRCGEYVGCDYYPQEPGVVQCAADALKFQDESFDAVVSFQVLEHVRRPWLVVRECARVLRHGGLLLVTAPFVFPHHSSPHDFFRFTHEGLKAMAEEAGLKVERLAAQCSSVATLLLMLNWYLMVPIAKLKKCRLTRGAGWLLTWALTVPINLLGLVFEAPFCRREFEKGNEGYSNYLMICRKA